MRARRTRRRCGAAQPAIARAARRVRDRDDPHLLADPRRSPGHGRRHACGAGGRRCTCCYGDGMAILAGDGLQAEAFTLLAREPADTEPATAARKLVSRRVIGEAAGPVGMVGGQAIDLQAAGQARRRRPSLDGDGAPRHARAKNRRADPRARRSAARSWPAATIARSRRSTRYAADVGLAFQIVDDILDVEGDAADARARAPGRTPPPRSRPIRRSSASSDRARSRPRCLGARHVRRCSTQDCVTAISSLSPNGS